MTMPSYRFRSTWALSASPADVYEVLDEVESYPHWWPEVKEAVPVGRRRFLLRLRSFVPVELNLVVAPIRADRANRVLEAALSGQLEGWARWTVSEHPKGSRVLFDEIVVPTGTSLNRAAFLVKPLMQLGHSLIMRHGEAGLEIYLAGVRRGRAGVPGALAVAEQAS